MIKVVFSFHVILIVGILRKVIVQSMLCSAPSLLVSNSVSINFLNVRHVLGAKVSSDD